MPKKRRSVKPDIPKYQQLVASLSRDILSGKYKADQRLPSEAALVRQSGTSRITVGRAMRELKAKGLVARIAGSGTYVRSDNRSSRSMLFGLLIPNLGETEIFEPICQGIAAAPQASDHGLLWGHAGPERATKEEQALELCRRFIDKKVSGVFFAPLEFAPAKDQTNLTIVSLLEKARIPIVLLDRSFVAFPERSRHDLVGIDNRRAGALATEHLLKLGCRRTAFLGVAGAASTINARVAGYREMLIAAGATLDRDFVLRPAVIDETTLRPVMDRKRPEAFVCANDRTAGQLMHSLTALGYRVPRDIRIVGIDDVEYARLLAVPLTTIHQPCREIGEAAMAAMLERIARPTMLARDILLDCTLVVRQSCGAV